MSTNQKKLGEGVTKRNHWACYPEDITIPVDPDHILEDSRTAAPLNENMVLLTMQVGVLQPIICRRNGQDKETGRDIIEVVDGRQRLKWAMEANRRLAEVGEDRLKVEYVLRDGSDAQDDHLKMMVAANTHVVRPSHRWLSEMLNKYVNVRKHTEEEATVLFNMSVTGIKYHLMLLSCDEAVLDALDERKITFKAARDMSAMPRAEQRQVLARVLGGETEPDAKAAGKEIAEEKGERGRQRAKRATVRKFKEVSTIHGLIKRAIDGGEVSKDNLVRVHVMATTLAWVAQDSGNARGFDSLLSLAGVSLKANPGKRLGKGKKLAPTQVVDEVRVAERPGAALAHVVDDPVAVPAGEVFQRQRGDEARAVHAHDAGDQHGLSLEQEPGDDLAGLVGEGKLLAGGRGAAVVEGDGEHEPSRERARLWLVLTGAEHHDLEGVGQQAFARDGVADVEPVAEHPLLGTGQVLSSDLASCWACACRLHHRHLRRPRPLRRPSCARPERSL